MLRKYYDYIFKLKRQDMFRIEIPFENIIRKRFYFIVILLLVLLNSPSTLSQGFSHNIQINPLSSLASDAG